MNEDLTKRIEALENFKRDLEAGHSFPIEVDQALTGRGYHKNQILFTVITLDFSDIATNASETKIVPLTGASINDPVLVSSFNAQSTGLFYTGYVSAPNQVIIRYDNLSGANANPVSSEFIVVLFKRPQ